MIGKQVNIDQWLSNEKAQLSLLVPPWVPNKTPLPKASVSRFNSA